MDFEPILPLKMIVFQVLFLMVAIAIEAGILRQRLRLGFETSVQYATVINIAAVVAGWIAFLIIEPLAPPAIKEQIIGYILFDHILINGWTTQVGATLLAVGLLGFFATFFIKAKGLEFFLRSDGAWESLSSKPKSRELSRDDRYAKARGAFSTRNRSSGVADFTDSVLQANAASFSAILLLILLRTVAKGWTA